MTLRRRTFLLLVPVLVACGRPVTPAEVASWLRASAGVLQSWIDGSISASAADSNLASTEKMLADAPRSALPEGVAPRLEQAGRVVADARRAITAGDRVAVKQAAAQLRILAAQLAP